MCKKVKSVSSTMFSYKIGLSKFSMSRVLERNPAVDELDNLYCQETKP